MRKILPLLILIIASSASLQADTTCDTPESVVRAYLEKLKARTFETTSTQDQKAIVNETAVVNRTAAGWQISNLAAAQIEVNLRAWALDNYWTPSGPYLNQAIDPAKSEN